MNRIGRILDTLPQQWTAGGGLAAAGVAWRLTAGPALGARMRVESWRDGVLWLAAADAACARQVACLESELLAGLNRRLGAGAVRGLRVVARGAGGSA